MRITLSSGVHLQRNKSEIEDTNSSSDNKISKGILSSLLIQSSVIMQYLSGPRTKEVQIILCF